MIVYLAASLQNDFRKGSQTYLRLTAREQEIVDNIDHRLESYHYVHGERLTERIRDHAIKMAEMGKNGKVFLDSGAFSSFMLGVEVDINEYGNYVKQNDDMLRMASVLDAIGDPEQTWRNQIHLERMGANVLPCYHFGEPYEVLEHYMENYDYITIGGMVPIANAKLFPWLDEIWGRYLTNPDGTAKIKVHGFGLTSIRMMVRYPWHSVDSASWVQVGGLGKIFLHKWDILLGTSPDSPSAKEKGKHVDNLTEAEREPIVRYIEEAGFDLERLRHEHLSRKVFNAMEYMMLMYDERHQNKTFKGLQPQLF